MAWRSLVDDLCGFRIGRLDDADRPEFFPLLLENLAGGGGVLFGDAQGHSDAAVERASKLHVIECGGVLEPVEYLRRPPGAGIDAHPGSRRQHPRNVLAQAAAGDMGNGFYRQRFQQGENAGDVDARRFEQDLDESATVHGHVQRRRAVGQNSADERKAVGVGTAGRKPDQSVAGCDAAAVDDGIVVDHADAETRQIVVIGGVHVGHLRRLAADERDTGELAAFGDAFDDPIGHLFVELAGGIIIEKIERLGALHDHVVGAHGHQIDADAGVDARIDGETQLGADAVGPRNQNRPRVAIHRQLEQAAEAAENGNDTAAPGAFRKRLDAVHQAIATFDVDTGIAVGDGFSPPGGHARNGTVATLEAQTLTWPEPLHSVNGMRIARLLRVLVPILAVVFSLPVPAAEEVKNLYEAEVGVADKARGSRNVAFGAALAKVAVKVSGRRGAATSPVIVEAMKRPERYVQQFRYQNVAAPALAAEQPAEIETQARAETQTLELWVQFDAPAVDALLREAGLPVWGRLRPSVLVLVAVESAGSRELLSSDDPRGWARFIQSAAAERAVPLVLPLMDLEDRVELRVSDVWAGFEDNVRRASERYQSEGVLMGRAYEQLPNFWQLRWRLLLEDVRHEWLDQGEGLDVVLLAGVHESADLLASRFGGFTGATAVSGVEVTVTGIRSLGDYARTLHYLGSLDEVSRVDVTNVNSAGVSFRVDARGGRETVRQVIALGRTLAEEGEADWSTGLNYRLLP